MGRVVGGQRPGQGHNDEGEGVGAVDGCSPSAEGSDGGDGGEEWKMRAFLRK